MVGPCLMGLSPALETRVSQCWASLDFALRCTSDRYEGGSGLLPISVHRSVWLRPRCSGSLALAWVLPMVGPEKSGYFL